MKYIVVTGGVISGLGKGITAASIGVLLKNGGYNVTMIKIDPYINVDAGTISPYEHGEVFVLNDGSETDLDLGNYERFLNIHLTNKHNITTGKIYKSVIDDERKGKYLGQTVQIIPHITNKIRASISEAAGTPINDSGLLPTICIIEVGGTIGDIEGMPFIEALRQMHFELDAKDMCFIHLSLVPKISASNEFKTKPTQNSVKDLRQQGLNPDLMIIRCDDYLDFKSKEKISMFCQVPCSHIFINQNVKTIYEVPIKFNEQNMAEIICDKLQINYNSHNGYLKSMNSIVSLNFPYHGDVFFLTIGIVGKYTELTDSYLSINKAIEHASSWCKTKIKIVWISSEEFKIDDINKCNGIIIPGGFGCRGINGMLCVCKYCRENNIPLLGICLGMHIMCIDAARCIYGINCNSEEFDPDAEHQIIKYVDRSKTNLGGTMKLGLHKTNIKKYNCDKNSTAYDVYNAECVMERHRHRYEFNPKYLSPLANKLFFSGISDDDNCVDIVENTSLKFYMGTQYHPEFLSTLIKPSPVFMAFIKACID